MQRYDQENRRPPVSLVHVGACSLALQSPRLSLLAQLQVQRLAVSVAYSLLPASTLSGLKHQSSPSSCLCVQITPP